MRDVASKVEIKDWRGLVTNIDPLDAEPGAMQEQVNLKCVTPGQAECRGGMQPIDFSGGNNSGLLNVHFLMHVETPSGQQVLYGTSDGKVIWGASPSV